MSIRARFRLFRRRKQYVSLEVIHTPKTWEVYRLIDEDIADAPEMCKPDWLPGQEFYEGKTEEDEKAVWRRETRLLDAIHV